MKTRILILASCLLAFASQAQEARKELWTWKDANGVVHFSDTPGPGAKRVDLVVTGPSSGGATAPASAAAVAAAQPPAAPVTYSLLEISQPENDASFFNADATVAVRVRSEPALAEGDTMSLLLDGTRVEGADNSFDYTLQNLPRGTHSIAATIRDRNGNERIRSQSVVFHMKQNTIIPPRAVGPGVRPVPRPTPRGG